MFNPKRLKTARVVRGLTRTALARASGVALVDISKIENGHAPFPLIGDTELWKKIADALLVPLDFFNGPDIPVYERGQASFRAKANLTKASIDMALGMMSWAHVMSEWFDEQVMNISVSVPDLSGETPEHAAEILRSEWGLGNKGINNVVHLLEVKGVRVFPADQTASSMDAFCGWLGDRPAIFLRRGTTGARCRFDACHELGHLALHRGREWGKGDTQMEAEADAFASAFLMPRAAVVSLVKPRASLLDLVSLKASWKVSFMALNRRAHDLGILPKAVYLENVKEASRRGWRSSEPNDVPFESSLVWSKAREYVSNSGLSMQAVADKIHLNAKDVERLMTSFVTTAASSLSVSSGRGNGHAGWAKKPTVIVNDQSDKRFGSLGRPSPAA